MTLLRSTPFATVPFDAHPRAFKICDLRSGTSPAPLKSAACRSRRSSAVAWFVDTQNFGKNVLGEYQGFTSRKNSVPDAGIVTALLVPLTGYGGNE